MEPFRWALEQQGRAGNSSDFCFFYCRFNCEFLLKNCADVSSAVDNYFRFQLYGRYWRWVVIASSLDKHFRFQLFGHYWRWIICISLCFSLCFSICFSPCLSFCLSLCFIICLNLSLSICLSLCLSFCFKFSKDTVEFFRLKSTLKIFLIRNFCSTKNDLKINY